MTESIHFNLADISKQMYCVQCQKKSKNIGCMRFGCCGKNPRISYMMDYLINILKRISYYSSTQKISLNEPIIYKQVVEFIMKSLFMTITNANFDEIMFMKQIKDAIKKIRQT